MTVSLTGNETYAFRLELMDAQGAAIAQRSLVEADFSRAALAAYWKAFCSDRIGEYAPQLELARVEPRFLSQAAEPSRAEGFRVVIPAHVGEPFHCDFSIRYFAAEAARLRAQFAPPAADAAESPLYYTLHSLLDDRDAPPVDPEAVELGPAVTSVPLVSRSRADLGLIQPWDKPSTTDVPVFVGRSVIEEAYEQATQHPEREVGGLLLGNVCRDAADGKLFVQVTCLVSGEGSTQSTATTVTFTPASFESARSMIALRGQGRQEEIVIGWAHSHPFRLCQECPLPTPPECVDKILFFSTDDVQVMETTFYQPFMVGLLTGVDARLERALGHAPLRCFRWNDGEVSRAGFFVYED